LKVDKLALEKAVRRDPNDWDDNDTRLWREKAEVAAGRCQRNSLRLKPREDPPWWANENDPGPAGALLRRMLAARVSRFEPDPIAALGDHKKRTTGRR
jgi:hypothetical protein